jgi:hypothetical protein
MVNNCLIYFRQGVKENNMTEDFNLILVIITSAFSFVLGVMFMYHSLYYNVRKNVPIILKGKFYILTEIKHEKKKQKN